MAACASDPDTGEDARALACWQVLARVPAGHVITYGQLAELAGLPRQARWVGRLLSQLPADSGLPWHRVVNAQGRLSLPPHHPGAEEQAARLRAEGVFLQDGKLNLTRYRWQP